MGKNTIALGIVDDHLLLRKALASLIQKYEDCNVVLEAGNGIELQEELKKINPDIILLDLQMPLMNGYETLCWLQKHFPSIRVIVLTVCEPDLGLVRMMKAGARAFLRKNIAPGELKAAIYAVKNTGFYYHNSITRTLLNFLYNSSETEPDLKNHTLSEKEIHFLKLAATELTYKEIASEMKLTEKAIEKIREALFLRLQVKNRVTLAVKAIHNGIAN